MATKNLGQISAIHIGTVEPQNKNLIWRDISQNPNLWKIWNSVSSVWEVVPSQAVANNFLNLGDTPVTYQGSGGKILKIKANLSGIEFVDEVTFLSEISAAIAKGTLVDADEFLLSDQGEAKKTAWSDIKATLKTYFDTLYVSVSTVTSQLITNWNTAFGWGNHADAGYLTSETDPVFTAHPASNVVNNGSGNNYLSDDGTYKAITIPDGSKWEDESATLIRPKDGKKVDASHIEGLEQGGHTILDPAENTMPTQPALQFLAGFTVTDEVDKTVVGNTAASHIDGAVEEKHQTNQIYEGTTPLSTILPQLVNLADIDVSDINVGEKKIIVAEKNAQGAPVFSGGVGLLDVIANPGLSTLLAETNPNWAGDEITLTGNNLEGQLGENSQFFELDADFFLCKVHNNGTTTSNGSATWKRNRGTDSLSLSIPAHVTIINQLETESGWNSVAQFKQITAKSKQGSWFRRPTGGYLYMCIDNSNGWTRIGPTPPTTNLEITGASHPILTASLAAHDFSTNRFYVEGTEPTDEPAEQGQEWWDTTNKYVYRRNMDGNWARLNG